MQTLGMIGIGKGISVREKYLEGERKINEMLVEQEKEEK